MAYTLESLGRVFDLLPDAIVMVDPAGKIMLASSAITSILGYEPKDLVGKSLGCLMPERYRNRHARMVNQFRDSGESGPMSARPLLPALTKNGQEQPVSIVIGSLQLDSQKVSVAVIRDAQPLHTTLQGALNQARRDPLTGMRNRRDFSARVKDAIETGSPFALLYLDLQHFKPFNDQYGHQVGDEVLRIVAQRIGSLVRADDVAARLGGDEFAMLLIGLTGQKPLRERAVVVADSVSAPFNFGEISGSVGVNIGAALFPEDGSSEEELLRAADRRMYSAKRKGQPLWFKTEH